jgi:hypothetical protein
VSFEVNSFRFNLYDSLYLYWRKHSGILNYFISPHPYSPSRTIRGFSLILWHLLSPTLLVFSLNSLLFRSRSLRLVSIAQILDNFHTWNWRSSRDSSVDIATGYGLDSRGSIPGRGKRFVSSPVSRPALGPTQPSIQRMQGVKRQGREADHSPPAGAEVWNAAAMPPLPHMSSWHSA